MPMAIMGAKFFMSLTLATPLATFDNRDDYYNSIHNLSMRDTRLQPHILDHLFFSGLDKLFLQHLYPSFQAFGMLTVTDAKYDQNKAPAIDDDDDDDDEDKEEDILSLDWRKHFEMEYMPALK